MTEHIFPWQHRDLMVAAFYHEEPETLDVFRCICAEHGALFMRAGGMLSIHEEGWRPFAWKVDDTPNRDDSKWPPLLHDYLTPENQ
jgi:hypothetical protein